MGFSDKLGDRSVRRLSNKESFIDRALRTWSEADARRLHDALHDIGNWTDREVSNASAGETPEFSESAVGKWRRDNGLR